MSDIFRVQWTLTPIHAPVPWRHCATCGTTKPFRSSGKVRLNANGRRLDAWLIYRCADCDRTWLRPLLERAAVDQVPPKDLDAMHHSDPAWVRRQEFDIAALGRHTGKITHGDALGVVKPDRRVIDDPPRAIELKLAVPIATDLRLDRFLARELPVSRGRLKAAHAQGDLVVHAADGSTSLRRKITADLTVTLFANGFSDNIFRRIREAVLT